MSLRLRSATLLQSASGFGLLLYSQSFLCNLLSHCRIEFQMSAGPGLESLVDQTISVITNDGRNIVGVLKGFDQATNIILDESHERVYSTKEGVQQLVLGLYIIRGDNISVVGELDEELDSSLDLSKLRAHPLKPVIH
ncbi:Sm-like protein LSM8 [Glycine max]|nr:Sm-like protein LSM8 [Glycine max]